MDHNVGIWIDHKKAVIIALSPVLAADKHPPADTGVDGAYAARTANKAYRTTPLRALWQHPPYFHDGSAATLADVVVLADHPRSRVADVVNAGERDRVRISAVKANGPIYLEAFL